MSKFQLPPEAQQLQNQIMKRANLLESEAERMIYVDMPQKTMEYDQLLKTHPMLQPEFIKKLDQEYRELLSFDKVKANEILDITPIIARLQIPHTCIFEMEDFMRPKLTELQDIMESIKRWLYVAIQTDSEPDEAVQKIDEALTSIEEGIRALFDLTLQYHTTRGKLVVKLQKRKLYDIAKTLVQFDITQITEFRNSFTDLYTNLIQTYDVTVKNFEQIKGLFKNQTPAGQAMGMMV